MPKMTVDKLAQITQNEFSNVYERFDGVDERLNGIDDKLNALQTGQERILEVLLEIPSKKAFERFQARTEARLTAVEKKVGI